MSGTKAIRAAAVSVIVTALSLGAAQADTYRFTDVQRPGGHARGAAAVHANEHSCGADANDHFGNVAAFKKCMRAHGWVADGDIPDPPASRTNPHLQPGDDYISTEDGMSCKSVGGIGICGPPRGTVHYQNDEGLNCTRNGLMSVCTNF